jgi:hypothetical protein
MTRKSLIGLLIALVIGGGIILYAYHDLTSGAVECGGQTMHRGDTCAVTQNGTSTTKTYDQKKSDGHQGDYIGMGFGGLIVAGAIFFTIAGSRARRAQARTAAQSQTG